MTSDLIEHIQGVDPGRDRYPGARTAAAGRVQVIPDRYLVLVDGKTLRPQPALTYVRLLDALARRHGHLLTYPDATAIAWPGHTPAQARRMLTDTFRRLRRALGPAGGLLREVPDAGFLLDPGDTQPANTGMYLNEATSTVYRDGRDPVPLTTRDAQLLAVLLRHAGICLHTGDLLTQLPPSAVQTLRASMRTLQRLLGDDPDHPRQLHTIGDHGYLLDPSPEPTTRTRQTHRG